MNRRWVCSDVWLDIFPHFDRPQLGLKLALLSNRFNALVDKHFDGKRELSIWSDITIGKMGAKAKLSVEKSNAKSVRFPLPGHSLPNKIRFNYLQIEYIDYAVIKFLRANQQIFAKGTDLDLHVPFPYKAKDVQNFACEIWPIFVTNIRHLSVTDGRHLENLRRHTSPTILSDLNINAIHSDDLLPDAIADDGPNATAGQALSKWLHIPRSDGQPKQLSCCGAVSRTIKLVNSFKEAFLHATTSSASYIIRLEDFEPTEIEPFELVNERTNEMLTFEKEDDHQNTNNVACLLKRFQIGGTATVHWVDENLDNLNNVNFHLYEFGPLSPPKTGQMKSKSHRKMKLGPSGQRNKKKKK